MRSPADAVLPERAICTRGLREDVAGKNFRRAAREGHGFGVEGSERNEIACAEASDSEKNSRQRRLRPAYLRLSKQFRSSGNFRLLRISDDPGDTVEAAASSSGARCA